MLTSDDSDSTGVRRSTRACEVCRGGGQEAQYPMKWPASSTNKENSGEKGRYLALPAVQEPRSVSAGGDTAAPPSAASSTGTWPPKRSRAPPPLLHLPPPPATQTVERPSTATLERPHLLDIDLLHRLDMSLVRKEFLCITNLCRMPLHARHVGPTPSPASSLIIREYTILKDVINARDCLRVR